MAISPTLLRERASLTGQRILIVEDEYFLADDISRALRSLGAEIAGPVAELDDARRALNDRDMLSGAVLDVNIHSRMVFPIARELRTRRVPFVFTTGYDRTAVAPEFHDVLLWEKPIDVMALAYGLAGLIQNQPT